MSPRYSAVVLQITFGNIEIASVIIGTQLIMSHVQVAVSCDKAANSSTSFAFSEERCT